MAAILRRKPRISLSKLPTPPAFFVVSFNQLFTGPNIFPKAVAITFLFLSMVTVIPPIKPRAVLLPISSNTTEGEWILNIRFASSITPLKAVVKPFTTAFQALVKPVKKPLTMFPPASKNLLPKRLRKLTMLFQKPLSSSITSGRVLSPSVLSQFINIVRSLIGSANTAPIPKSTKRNASSAFLLSMIAPVPSRSALNKPLNAPKSSLVHLKKGEINIQIDLMSENANFSALARNLTTERSVST